jgi:uncharacterized protein (TIGR02453 family)
MTADPAFNGFPLEALDFLADLSLNNTRPFFEAHRGQFERFCLAPSRAFVTALGERLRDDLPAIVADPRTGRSIFRMHRDTRLSKNKDPFKNHLGFYLWEGENKNTSPGIYVHIEVDKVIVGSGTYIFDRDALARYRQACADPVVGAALQRALEPVRAAGMAIHGSKFKRLPVGIDASHPNAALLLHEGLWMTAFEAEPPAELEDATFVDFVYDRVAPSFGVHRWLAQHVGG